MTTVTLRGLSKTYHPPVPALEQVDLTLNAGELMVVVGPSGSGKTTLLRLIAGLEVPTHGEIWFGEQMVNHLPTHKRNISLLFQQPALFSHLTAAENMVWGCELREGKNFLNDWFGGKPFEATQVAQEVAERLGIGALLQRYPAEMSGGEQQRVAFGRALLRHPAVFLLDEPFTNLDAPTRMELRKDFRRNHMRHPITTIYVTHDQAEALSLAERVMIMHQGKVQQIGTPAEVYEHPANTFVAQFLGSPGMNLWLGQFQAAESGFIFIGAANAAPTFVLPRLPEGVVAHEQVIAGIRPEHVVLQLHAEGIGVVTELEYRGDTSLLHIASQGSQEPCLVVKKSSREVKQWSGSRVTWQFPVEHLQWFHATNQQRIK